MATRSRCRTSSRSAALGLPVRFGDKAGGVGRGLAGEALHLCRGLSHPLDQPLELAFDDADARDMLLGAPELSRHIANLAFQPVQALELRALLQRCLEIRRELIHARIERLDCRRGRGAADRMLEALRHVDQPLIEILFAREGGRRGRHREVGLWRRRCEGEVGSGRWR